MAENNNLMQKIIIYGRNLQFSDVPARSVFSSPPSPPPPLLRRVGLAGGAPPTRMALPPLTPPRHLPLHRLLHQQQRSRKRGVAGELREMGTPEDQRQGAKPGDKAKAKRST